MMFCSKCGSDLRGNKSRCPTCGYGFNQMKQEDSQRTIGYRHSEIKKEIQVSVVRDEDGDIIPGYSPERIRIREEEERPRTIVFKKALGSEKA